MTYEEHYADFEHFEVQHDELQTSTVHLNIVTEILGGWRRTLADLREQERLAKEWRDAYWRVAKETA